MMQLKLHMLKVSLHFEIFIKTFLFPAKAFKQHCVLDTVTDRPSNSAIDLSSRKYIIECTGILI